MTDRARIPVTVVTGWLGAGKTSLVNHLLKISGRKLAVIVNEFGDIGIDGALIDSGAEELIELNAGCVCCVVRGDLIRTLRGLLRQGRGFDGIVIETTGLANPGPVIQTFQADQQLAARCRLDAVVCVVDALHIEAQLGVGGDAADQVALASVVLLNKASEAGDASAIEVRLRRLNPLAEVHRVDRGRADPALVFDTRGFDLERVGAMGNHPHAHDHGPGGIGSVSLHCDEPLDAGALSRWLSDLLAVRGADILRTKGIVWAEGDDRRLVIQAVHMLMEGDFIGEWPAGSPRESRLVFIGRNLDATTLRAGLLSCRAKQTV